MSVLLIGTLDTKSAEVAFVCDRLAEQGLKVLVMDAGVFGDPPRADYSREQVFQAAGTTLAEVREAADRGNAVAKAAEGVAKLSVDLHRAGQIDAVMGLGGSGGTIIATSAMRVLPIGLPKLMISTIAAGQTKPYIGERDVVLWPSVVDVAGVNRISRVILTNAALAMAGMLKLPRPEKAVDKPIITATMFGVTTPCVDHARKLLESSDFEVLVFHATGTGGRTMETLIEDGLVSGVLDFTTTELADELDGGVFSAGKNRLTAAGRHGIPQVITVGALDMVNFGGMQPGGLPDGAAEKYRGRLFYRHNPVVTLMRTTPEENTLLGREIAEKANAAKGPTAIVLPLKGVSAIDAEGKPFWNPEADAALFSALRSHVRPPVQLIELDLHINDPAFAESCVRTLQSLMSG